MSFLGTILAVPFFAGSGAMLYMMGRELCRTGIRRFFESFGDPTTGTTAFFAAYALFFVFGLIALTA